MVEVPPDFLINGRDYLAQHPGFKIVGRKDDLNAAVDVMLRKSPNRNLVLYGKGGTGLSSLVMGLQASKEEPGASADLVEKSFYYLDVDALFSSGDASQIKEGFQKAMKTLEGIQNPVLIIENTNGFLEGVSNNNVSSIVNTLMRETRTNPHFQTIFMAANDDLGPLFKAHEDIEKNFTFLAVEEPSRDDLRPIIEAGAAKLGEQYGVTVSKEAIDSVLEMTRKYAVQNLPSQPKRSLIILEGAITAFRRAALAQERPPELVKLEETLAAVNAALASGQPAQGDLADRSPDELASLRKATEDDIDSVTKEWKGQQEELQKLSVEIADAEEEIRRLNGLIDAQKAKEAATQKVRDEAIAQFKAAEGDVAKQELIRQVYKDRTQETLVIPEEKKSKVGSDFLNMTKSLSASTEVRQLEADRKGQQEVLNDSRDKYAKLVKKINASKKDTDKKELVLADTQVLTEFSRLSNVPMNKLKQDETEKLLHLADTIKDRVFGQDKPADALADAVISAKAGLKGPQEPIGNFLFLGPSGVGKTEMAKALANALFGEDDALQSYAMSEYMQETAINVLIGSPQGYEGWKEGGILTNNMASKPYCVNLFDEIEKADKQIFDIFLQIFDEGTLTDRRNMKVSFANSINIMTSNIGSKYFLDESLSFKDATKKALADLWNPDGDPNDPNRTGGFRPEFLNRFTGIFCFNRLGQVEIVRIANKNLTTLNELAADKGISITMPEEAVKEMCQQQYDPKTGGRGIRNYIKGTVRKDAAKSILLNPDISGVVKATYVPGKADDQEVAEIRREVEEDTSEIRAKVESQVTPKQVAQVTDETQRKVISEEAVRLTAEAEKELAAGTGTGKTLEEKVDAKIAARVNELVTAKMKAKVEERVQGIIEEKVQEKIKDLEREKAKISATFTPADPAAGPARQVAANANHPRPEGKKPAAG